MEQYSKITRFCIICNYHNKIIDPIISRCSLFRFKPIDKDSMIERLKFIANKELIGQLFEVAKSRGATKMQAMVRPSMERLLSRSKFKSVSTMVEYKL